MGDARPWVEAGLEGRENRRLVLRGGD